jgi:hypothetical protein
MDRMLACEAGDPGSIPGESTRQKIWTTPDFLLLVLAGAMFFHQKKQAR